MRVAIVVAPKSSDSSKLNEIAKGFSDGFSKLGHTVDVISALRDSDKRLSIYDYIIVLSEPLSAFSGKTPDCIRSYLAGGAGAISGKRCSVFLHGGIRKNKALQFLMRTIEGEGIILKSGDLVKSRDEAKAIALHLNIERNY